jgi:hypothetical protein
MCSVGGADSGAPSELCESDSNRRAARLTLMSSNKDVACCFFEQAKALATQYFLLIGRLLSGKSRSNKPHLHWLFPSSEDFELTI